MGRKKLPSLSEMTRFIAAQWRHAELPREAIRALDAGDYQVLHVDGLAIDDAIKQHYYAWSLYELAVTKGEPISASTVQSKLQDVPGAEHAV